MDTLLEKFRKKPKVMEHNRYKINIPVSEFEGNKGQTINKDVQMGEEEMEEDGEFRAGEDARLGEDVRMDEVQQKITGVDGFKIIDNTKILKKSEIEKYNELRMKIMGTMPMPVYKVGEKGEKQYLESDGNGNGGIKKKVTDIRQDNNNGLLPGEKLIKVKKRVRKTKATDLTTKSLRDIANDEIGEELLPRVPKKEDLVLIKHASYYMNNREKFVYFINNLFRPYRDEILKDEGKVSCDRSGETGENKLFTHQKIIRDYINLYTPYRGLLLYHGLGSGKTCGSIAIAEGFLGVPSIAFVEGLTSVRKVVVMTPASLQTNFIEELKRCGNPIFKKKQYWEFVSVEESNDEMINQLSSALGLPRSYIKTSRGAWFVDVRRESNYDVLSTENKKRLEDQINEMINQKYSFIAYNGLRKRRLSELTRQGTYNIFDNRTIIIDEAHNFVSLIVNKIDSEKDLSNPTHTSTILYKMIMEAQNARVILLTGTPMVNYPNEIGILFNLLRGYIRTWKFPIKQEGTTTARYTTEMIEPFFKKHNIVDYIEVVSNEIILTRNPYEFTNKFYTKKDDVSYLGTRKDSKEPFLNDSEFINNILKLLQTNNINIDKSKVKIELHKALPDRLNDFMDTFIDEKTGKIKNEHIFKRRILGLTSYFKSAQEGLMPKYDIESDYHLIRIDMSDYQFSKYEEIRLQERDKEVKSARKTNELYGKTNSSYRIFSRAYCNFVFPSPPGRPMPKRKKIQDGKEDGKEDKFEIEAALDIMRDEDDIDGISVTEKRKTEEGVLINNEEVTDVLDESEDYPARIQNALAHLQKESSSILTHEALEIYSPKFLHMLENIEDVKMVGSHLIYSQFRTLEGIGIFSLILEANGFAQFKIKKVGATWTLDIPEEKRIPRKMFALYTGTETTEEKELIRNIFNGEMDLVPTELREQILKISAKNLYGELIKIFMITASGAEGISLKNVRYVHITEPYWHPVRKEQVIGRARRICSHSELPEEERNIKVFMYIMTFTEAQIRDKMSITLKNNDRSKFNKENKRPLTTDEALYEIMNRKEDITNQIVKSIKETSFDCAIHNTGKSGEILECFGFGNETNAKIFSYKPNIEQEDRDTKVQALNLGKESWRARRKVIDGKAYALRLDENGETTNKLYDLVSFERARDNPGMGLQAEFVGKIIKQDGKEMLEGI